MSASGRKRPVNLMFFIDFERPLSGKAAVCRTPISFPITSDKMDFRCLAQLLGNSWAKNVADALPIVDLDIG